MRVAFAISSAMILAGCHSAGAYGYSRTYEPLSAEADAADAARDYDPVMAEREKTEWRKQPISIFGIVGDRTPSPGGGAYVKLSVRTLEQRNLCESLEEETCRVTVSEHEHAIVHAKLALSQADDIGDRSIGKGSLVRVIGKLTDDVDPEDGSPVVRAEYYRHWPRNFFVTTASRADLPM